MLKLNAPTSDYDIVIVVDNTVDETQYIESIITPNKIKIHYYFYDLHKLTNKYATLNKNTPRTLGLMELYWFDSDYIIEADSIEFIQTFQNICIKLSKLWIWQFIDFCKFLISESIRNYNETNNIFISKWYYYYCLCYASITDGHLSAKDIENILIIKNIKKNERNLEQHDELKKWVINRIIFIYNWYLNTKEGDLYA